MKVFACERSRRWSGGVALVAANSIAEAFTLFFNDPKYDVYVNKFIDGDFTDDICKWETYEYNLENWFEIPMLTANVETPQIIIEDGYTE